ncbi:DUF6286 domain-containing protein [Streptomyces anulatus]|uniref:DUF6286 domain-containing protein n=1 Tax=Streptomyces anulatus TaxID=1892 RepID=UPI00369C0483
MSASERGATTIADRATAKIARQAAAEATAAIGGHVARSAASTAGRSAAVTVRVDLPLSAPADTDLMGRLHDHLTSRTGLLTGLAITPARIRIRRLTPGAPTSRPREGQLTPVGARRPWSGRRLPAIGVAAAVAALSVLLLWAVLQQHVPGISTPPWQVMPGTEGARLRPLMYPAVVLAALTGGWLIVLALTPGHRSLLALGCPAPVRAVTTRTHAARLMRACVSDIPGLRVRAVRFTRRQVTVRAEAAFGSPQELREQTIESIERALRSMALERKPRVRVALRDIRDPRTDAVRCLAQGDADA